MVSKVSDTYKQMVVDAGNKMVEQGLTVGTWGNVSVRDPKTNLIYIKPSGMPYGDITKDDIVVFNDKLEIVWGHRKPSIEYHFHIAIMNARLDVNTVIHTHPIHSTAFGVARQDIPGVCEDFVQLVGDKVTNAAYSLPGTPELAVNVVKALGNSNAVLIPNHGTVCVGSNVDMALKVCHVVEKSAQVYIYAKILGEPHIISEEDMRVMQDFAKNHYGQDKK